MGETFSRHFVNLKTVFKPMLKRMEGKEWSYWTYYNNIEYIRIDFRKGKSDMDNNAIHIINDSVELGLEREDKSIRALILVQGTKIRPETIRIMKKIGKDVQPKMKKSAIVGAVGILSLLVRIYISYTGSSLRFFTNERSALEYITSD